MKCPEVNEDGLPCQKLLYGNLDIHTGGHIFASDESWLKLMNDHYNPMNFFSGEPIDSHSPEDCTDYDFCKDNYWIREK